MKEKVFEELDSRYPNLLTDYRFYKVFGVKAETRRTTSLLFSK